MKLIFFSDIHGNNYAFNEFIKEVSSYKDEYTKIFLGDFIGYYYHPDEIIEYCRKNNIICLLGNHDQYFLHALEGKINIESLVKTYGRSYELALKSISDKNIEFLRKLDKARTIQSGKKKVYFCHGSPLNNLEGRIYPDCDLSIFKNILEDFDYIVTGQTHHKMVKSINSTVFLNPGSLGQQRDGRGCSYLILDLDKDTYDFHVVSYNIKKLEDEIDIYDKGSPKLKSVLRRIS